MPCSISEELEGNPKYRVCCRLFHVKDVIVALTIFKTLFVVIFVAWRLAQSSSFAVLTLASIFGLSMILSSYGFLVIGVVIKRYTLLIPYFTLCVLLILILMMKLFVEVMSTANTKDTLQSRQMKRIGAQTFVVMVEIYSVYLVWKVFNYITDSYMEDEYLMTKRLSDRREQYFMDLGISSRKPKLVKISIDNPLLSTATASLIINQMKPALKKALPQDENKYYTSFNTVQAGVDGNTQKISSITNTESTKSEAF
uniref:Uncharacterized protein n=1 Tax=Ditylenchus dipsaci TaxID=166011 RepID=A0A915DNZ9_9BILA